MSDRHSFPHYPRYYCTACENLLTAEVERSRPAIQEHITNTHDAEHRDRSGSSVSAPITTTSTDTDWVEPIWKSEGDTETEQLIYLALLRYPHLSIRTTHTETNQGISISELLDIPHQEISSVLFDSPSIVRLRARSTYEYTNSTFARPLKQVTVDPKKRLIHRKVKILARDTAGCSIKPDGGFDLPNVSARDIAEEFNEKQLPREKPETAAISSNTTTSPEEVQDILQNTAIEPQLPKARHHAAIIAARTPNITRSEAATKATNKLDQNVTVHQVGSVTQRRAWKSFDGSKLSELIYRPEAVARDLYAVLQETSLNTPVSVEERVPDEAISSASNTESPEPDPASASDANHSQESARKTDGGPAAAETSTDSEPPITPSLTATSADTTNDIATLVQTALTETTADSERAEAALNVYKQLPKPTRQTILTNIRTETTDEIFTSLANHL